MKNILLSFVFVVAFCSLKANTELENFNNTKSTISFTENKGQVSDQNYNPRPDVLFSGAANGLTFHIRNNGVSYQTSRVDSWKLEDKDAPVMKEEGEELDSVPDQMTIYRTDINWLGFNKDFTIEKGEATPGFDNYYLPSCPDGALNVKSYTDVTFKNLYDGIDVKWYEKNGELEYDFMVAPYADYSTISWEIEGADEISIGNEGQLVIETPLGNIEEQAPIAFQNGKKMDVNWLINGNIISLKVYEYDRQYALVIDPVVRVWGTYYGGINTESGCRSAIDKFGNVYVSGTTKSTSSIATSGSHQNNIGGSYDFFLVKFDAGGVRQWGTYYGGINTESGCRSAIDKFGNVYISGSTSSTSSIATSGSHQFNYGGGSYDAFLVKFDAGGIRQWGTYYGGADEEYEGFCSLDTSGNIYLSGRTKSTSGIATSNAHQSIYGGDNSYFSDYGDAFLVKFNSNGVRQWGTYYGGDLEDYGLGCVADVSENIYLSGMTKSNSGIATSGAFLDSISSNNQIGFLVKFDAGGVRQWGTYYGGISTESGCRSATDNFGNVYISGNTQSNSGIATSGSHQSINSNTNKTKAFLVKFNSNGLRQWGTYYGGVDFCASNACSIDASGNVFLIGATKSTSSIATSGSHQLNYGGGNYDAFLVKFDSTGARQWGTYYGGSGDETGSSCSTGASGNVYISGSTSSTSSIATYGSHQFNYVGVYRDAFLAKFSDCSQVSVIDTIVACDSLTWINGITYTSNNSSAKDTFSLGNGCDSIITLNLTINNSTTSTDTQVACDAYTWIDGNTYTATNNIATHTLTNAAGCDSVVTLNLTINQADTSYTNITACDSVVWNGTTYTQSGTYSPNVDSDNNYSMSFDGVDDYVEAPSISNYDTIRHNLTLSSWIRLDSSWSYTGTVVARRNFVGNPTGERHHFELTIMSDRSIIFSTSNNQNNTLYSAQLQTAPNVIGLNSWHYVSCTFLNGVVTIYIDGSVVVNQNFGYKEMFPNNHWVNFGRIHRSGGQAFFNEFNGEISDVEIWATALSQSEIQNNMNCPPMGNELGLVGYWNFEEGSGNTVFDQTSNGNNGTINGATYDSNVPAQSCGLTNSSGCDSTAVLNLTINNFVTTTDTTTICDGASVTIGNNTYTAPGNYTDSLLTANGCDSIVNTTIEVIDVNITQNDTTICFGDSITLNVNGATQGVNFQQACTFNELPTNLQNGLVAWYPYCGNANDESVNGNNGSVNGATLTSDRFGNGNSAYYFSSSGCGTRIDANVNTNSINGALTISIWVLRSGSGCYNPRYFEAWSGSNSIGHLQLAWYNSYNYPQGVTHRVALNNSGYDFGPTGLTTTSFSSIPNDTWTHIVYSNDGTNAFLWQDGVLRSTGTNPPGSSILMASDIAVGRINHPAWDAFNGNLDDIGIWNRVLSSQEIQDLYSGSTTAQTTSNYLWSTGDTTANINVSPTQTTTYWVQETHNGISCTDSVTVTVSNPQANLPDTITTCDSTATITADAGYNYLWNTGDTTQSITVNQSGTYGVTVSDTATISVSNNYSMSFDGIDDFVVLANAFFGGGIGNNFTMECWVNTPNTAWNQAIWGKSGTQSWSEAFFGFGHDFQGLFWKDANPVNQTYNQLHTGATPTVNVWHHYAVCQLNNQLSVYVDGLLVGSMITDGQVNWQSQISNAIGNYNTSYFEGLIDEFRVSNIARYQTNFTPPTCVFVVDANTEALYHFDEGSGNLINDYSGNNNHGTINGAAWSSNQPFSNCINAVSSCSSTDSVYVQISTPVYTFDTLTVCDSYLWNGNNYTSTGLYVDTLTVINGCDSIITLNLTINNSTTSTDTQVACDAYTWIDGNTYTASNNIATHTLTNVAGCDSVVTLNLTIDADNFQEPLIDDTLAYCNNNKITLDAGTFFNSYLWSNAVYTNGQQCVSPKAYPNWDSTSTSQTNQINQSGTYYVKVNSINNCEYLDSIVVSMLNPSIIGDAAVQAGDTAVLLASIAGVGFLLDSYDTTYLTSSDNIQNALDSANSGTVIMLAPGTYYENIVWPHTSNLVLSSSHGPEQTVINGSNNQESVIYVGNGQSGVVIDNLHITNGYGSFSTFHSSIRFGGGVLMDEDVRGVIKNCLLTKNGISPVNEHSGALFVSYRSEVYLVNNTITGNYGPTWWRSGYANCMFSSVLSSIYGRDGICMNNIMYNNAGYGLYNQYSLPKNSIHIRNNNSNSNGGQYSQMSNWYDSNGISSYTETGFNGNISQAPLFIDAANNDYRLSNSSPSKNAGQYGVSQGYEYYYNLSDLVYYPEKINYSWSNGDSTQEIIVNPSVTTSYYLTVTDGISSCTNSLTVAVCNSNTGTDVQIIKTICDDEVYVVNGNNYTQTGVYLDTLQSALACDSVIETTLTVNPTYLTQISASICDNQTFTTAGNQIVSVAGLYLDTLQSALSCDSVIETNLTVNPTYLTQVSASICDDAVYAFNGNSYTQTGVYLDTLQSALTCDSVIETTLTIDTSLCIANCQPTTDSISINSCSVYTSPSGNYTWNNSGIYHDTLQNIGGCDSILVINLKIDMDISYNLTEDTISVCSFNNVTIDAGNGFSKYLWNTGDTTQTISVNASGNYIITITEEACTAVDTVTVSIISSFFNSNSATICEGDTFSLKIFTSDTSLRFAWFAEADSSISTPHYYLGTKYQCEQYDQFVTANENYRHNDNWANPDQHAYPISLLFNGISNPNWNYWRIIKHPNYPTNLPLVSYIQTNWDTTSSIKVSPNKTTTYYCSVSDGINVCTDTFTLNVKSTSETNISISTINKHTSSNGKVYYQSTIYSDTLSNVNGCDSIITTNLTVFPPPDYTKAVSDTEICSGEQVTISINARDTINNPYINARGCVVCDMLSIADIFYLNGMKFTVADSLMIKDSLNSGGDIARFCVSKIINMNHLFEYDSLFNQDISNWDVSNVISMHRMFRDVSSFNQNIGNWDVSNTKDLSWMFLAANSFNQNIGNWDVSNVENMNLMFGYNSSFNQDIGNWDVSNVKDMSEMFEFNTAFNQSLNNWDVSNVTNMNSMFTASIFNNNIENWNVSNVSLMGAVFTSNHVFNQDIGNWDVSNVTNMSGMFNDATSFNQDLSYWCVVNILSEPVSFSFNSSLSSINKPAWGTCAPFINNKGCVICKLNTPGDSININGIPYKVVDRLMLLDSINNGSDLTKLCVSKVIDMNQIFRSKSGFNQNISNWDVGDVTNMNRMFQFASSFNQDISSWDVGNVQNMGAMFHGANSFNKNINTWDVSKVTNMEWMFRSASSFNQSLNNWDVSNVINMERMFQDASNLNSSISSWQVNNVTNMKMMFYSAYSFNNSIENWNVSNVINMESMFSNDCCFDPSMQFNQKIGNWDVSNVVNIKNMFLHAAVFNQDLSLWDVSNVTNMEGLFHNASNFNQDIGNWDVSNVTNMNMMFRFSTNFNQNLSNWCVSNFSTEPPSFSTNSALSTNNNPVWGTCPP